MKIVATKLNSILPRLALGFAMVGLGSSAMGKEGEKAAREVVVRCGEIPVTLNAIPAGSFKMGDARERPLTLVHLSKSFWMARFEITQEVWRAVMGTSPSQGAHVGPVGKVKDAPVENVSWDDAVAFCRKLNEQEKVAGRVPAGYEYRLPTEAEWEYACRAGTTYEQEDPKMLSEVSWHYGWDGGNSECHTHAVGLKRPNAWGLYDMIGNVYEWCADWYGPYVGGEATDPTGPKSGVDRVNRGGSFDTLAEDARAATRNGVHPSERTFTIGFRIVLAPQLR